MFQMLYSMVQGVQGQTFMFQFALTDRNMQAMLLLTKSKGHESENLTTQDSQTTFKPNPTCIFLSVRAK